MTANEAAGKIDNLKVNKSGGYYEISPKDVRAITRKQLTFGILI